MLILELFHNPRNNHLVEVITTKMGVTISGHHLKHTIGNLQHSEVRSTTTNICHHNLLCLVSIDTISKCGGGRFIDDSLHIKTSNLTGILDGLTGSVIIICRTGNDSILHFLSKIIFRSFLHLLKNHRRQFLR